MDSAGNIETLKRWLRRSYADNAAGLSALADKLAADAVETVTFTGQVFEGGNATGQITFPKMDYLAAVLDVLEEVEDPDDTPEQPARGAIADFSQRRIET